MAQQHLPAVRGPRSGRTRLGRLARRVTGGPGTPVFEAAVSVRQLGYRLDARRVAAKGRLTRMPTELRPGHTALRVAGYPVQARVVPDATPRAEQHRLLAAVAAELAARDVDYFVVPGPSDVFTLGVPGRNRKKLHAALQAVATGEDLLVSPVDPTARWSTGPTPTSSSARR